MSRAVVKLGGSLLDWGDFPRALRRYLDAAGFDQPTLIVGGGRMVDELRALDALHGLGEVTGHRLALRILEASAGLVERLVPRTRFVADAMDLEPTWQRGEIPILSALRFLDAVPEIETLRLPATWETTTDSIAAWLARYLGCGLVLLKSTAPEGPIDRRDAVRRGLVDGSFVLASAGLPSITIVNLRAENPTEIPVL